MPNLNIIDEEGTEGGMTPISTPVRRKGGRGGGGGVMRIIIVVFVLVVLAGGVFLLNKYGIVKLWGKKSPPVVAQVQQEPFPDQPFPETETKPEAFEGEEASGIEFVDIPPIDETKKKPGTRVEPSKEMAVSTGTSRLAGMKGNYTIQVSAWRAQETAQKYVKRLEEAGYPAFVEKRQYKDGTWFTVRIGRYQSVRDAKSAVQNFAYELRSNYWIDRVRMQ